MPGAYEESILIYLFFTCGVDPIEHTTDPMEIVSPCSTRLNIRPNIAGFQAEKKI